MNYYYQGKKIGEVEDGVLKKRVSKKVHLLRRLDAWAIDYWLLTQLPNETVIEIYDKDDKKTYTTTKQHYWSKGEVVEYGNFGKQVALTRSQFS